jgi:hypothetical protein
MIGSKDGSDMVERNGTRHACVLFVLSTMVLPEQSPAGLSSRNYLFFTPSQPTGRVLIAAELGTTKGTPLLKNALSLADRDIWRSSGPCRAALAKDIHSSW